MLLGALASGCAKRASSEAGPPTDTGDDLTALEQQLTRRESELQAIGVAPKARVNQLSTRDTTADATADTAGGAPATVGGAPATVGEATPTAPSQPEAQTQRPAQETGVDRCERVCEISAAICTLEDQICGLLPRHQGDARYQNACDRSVADCQVATEACHACTAN